MRGIVALGCLFALLLVLPLQAQHGTRFAWMGACCGEYDCQSAVIAIRDFAQGKVLINLQELVIQPQKIFPSQDGDTYWCKIERTSQEVSDSNTRCVFYAEGI